jgi:putative hydroxymethylpyrimidine transporter CytX
LSESTANKEKEMKKTWEGGIAVVPPAYRTLRGIDFFFLWAGAAIVVVMWLMGSVLGTAGFWGAFEGIVAAAVIGTTIFALAGVMGSDHGIPSMVSTRASFGVRGAYLGAVMNVIQLIFWCALNIYLNTVVVQLTSVAIGFPFEWTIATVICGILCTAIALGGAIAWKWFTRVAALGILILSVVATWAAFQGTTFGAVELALPFAGMGPLIALDICIGMPLSWAPLVSDYTRFSKSTKGAFWGSFISYAPTMIWFYTTGLILLALTGTYLPTVAMAALGLGIPALALLWFATLTTNFLNVYSGAMSILTIIPKVKSWIAIVFVGVLGTGFALLPWLSLATPFISYIGQFFIPWFAIVLIHYFYISKRKLNIEDLYSFKPTGSYWYVGGVSISAIVTWLIGVGIYEFMKVYGQWVGSALVSFVASVIIYLILYKAIKR